MYAAIATVPILLAVVLMVGFNRPEKVALPVAWLTACVITMVV